LLMYDLVIRGGEIIDGTGGEPFQGDVAMAGGKIVAIGRFDGRGGEEIDARGKIVTPGFIDIHTHYDGQVAWEACLQPSSWHGVTTVIGGNCGVGFAPCKPAERDLLVKLMEGVEDVPEIVMTTGLPWTWESFDEYLNFLEQRKFDIDFGAQIPHSPLRVYVMGERGSNREPATAADNAEMTRLVEAAVRAGAFGVTTSRHIMHRSKDGRIAPSVDAAELELLALAEGLKRAGAGVYQIIPALDCPPAEEYALMTRLTEASGRPLSFSLLAMPRHETWWRDYLNLMDRAQPAAAPIRAQIYPRPVGVMYGLDLSFHPFSLKPSYRPIANLPLAQRVAEMRKPEMRAKLLAEKSDDPNPLHLQIVNENIKLYFLGDPPCYNPPKDAEIGLEAARRGVSKAELLYELLLENDGKALLYSPASNYLGNSMAPIQELLDNQNTVLGLGDGGAHYGMICDASYSTFTLMHWVRDARPGNGIPLAEAVKKLAADPAACVGLNDRGVIAIGKKADLNLIDIDQLSLGAPAVIHDLPGGGRRLRQHSKGYVATVVNGDVTYRDGVSTGALPGRLVRRS